MDEPCPLPRQKCVDKQGAFFCKCDDGFVMVDGEGCKSVLEVITQCSEADMDSLLQYLQVADIFKEAPTHKLVLKALSAVEGVTSASLDSQDLTIIIQLLENVTAFILDFQKTDQDIMLNLNEVRTVTAITLIDYSPLLCSP